MATRELLLSGFLECNGRVKLQGGVLFDKVDEAMCRRLCEADFAGLVGDVVLPDGSFKGCAVLRTVAWPVGLTNIGAVCFEGCGLEEVNLVRTRVNSIGRRAFLWVREALRYCMSFHFADIGFRVLLGKRSTGEGAVLGGEGFGLIKDGDRGDTG